MIDERRLQGSIMDPATKGLQLFLDAHDEIHNFDATEVTRHNDVPPMHLWSRIIPTLLVAEWLREDNNIRYVIVSSGYRSPNYNERVGGAENSQHLYFNALDLIPVPDKRVMGEDAHTFNQMQIRTFAEKRIGNHPLASFMGIGIYNTFIHIDTRGLFGFPAPARWEG